ncbi:hypothetical protein T492DRAFT_1148186 [Pavlovales sp. CCMP2436]|nr:hypothetical protein T492DRAFT_1148186 [Pavlovales sp. CCMP2436]
MYSLYSDSPRAFLSNRKRAVCLLANSFASEKQSSVMPPLITTSHQEIVFDLIRFLIIRLAEEEADKAKASGAAGANGSHAEGGRARGGGSGGGGGGGGGEPEGDVDGTVFVCVYIGGVRAPAPLPTEAASEHAELSARQRNYLQKRINHREYCNL